MDYNALGQGAFHTYISACITIMLLFNVYVIFSENLFKLFSSKITKLRKKIKNTHKEYMADYIELSMEQEDKKYKSSVIDKSNKVDETGFQFDIRLTTLNSRMEDYDHSSGFVYTILISILSLHLLFYPIDFLKEYPLATSINITFISDFWSWSKFSYVWLISIIFSSLLYFRTVKIIFKGFFIDTKKSIWQTLLDKRSLVRLSAYTLVLLLPYCLIIILSSIVQHLFFLNVFILYYFSIVISISLFPRVEYLYAHWCFWSDFKSVKSKLKNAKAFFGD